MPCFRLAIVIFIFGLITGCGPAAIVGVVGSTITNAAYHSEQRKRNNQEYIVNKGLRVAIANLNLGVAYMQQEEYEKALDKILRAQLADPSYSPTYNVLGLLYQRLGEFDKAEKNFQKAIKLAPEDSSHFNNYGLLLCEVERWPEAKKAFIAAAENPLYLTPELAYTNIGTCALKNNETELAETYFRKALALNTKIVPALMQMAQLSYEKSNYLSAKGFLNRYLALASHTAATLLLGIRIENELGDRDKVASYVLLLKSKFPGTPELDVLNTLNI